MALEVLDLDNLYRRAADIFAEAARKAVDERGVFTVALSGGKTPEPLFTLLAERPLPWDKTQVFFADERCVPPEHPDSNFGMVRRLLFSRINIPSANVHRMMGELDPDEAAGRYEIDMCSVFDPHSEDFARFDLMHLGMGEDGHTASLFPMSSAIDEVKRLVIAVHDPKLEHARLTMTKPVLLWARRTLILVTGANKADTLKLVLDGPYDPHALPAQLLRNAQGEVTWLVDPAADGASDQ